MNRTIIERTNQFRLTSIGNCAAYEFDNLSTGETKFIQYGDDANTFRQEYEDMSSAHYRRGSVWNKMPWNDCLAFLFNECC
jgi:hypothetical protein